jgi:CO/xanthine dehydrogenase FAD-binding subunit
MYSANFDYHRARSLADVHRLLAANPGAKLLAGGHSLIPLMKLRLAAPSAVVDIGRIPELRGISRSGDTIRIGALTTHAEIAASADVQKAAPALAEAAGMIGDPAVRSRGTIGGNIAHADPASDLPTVLVALDARVVVVGPSGERTIAADGILHRHHDHDARRQRGADRDCGAGCRARTGVGLREVFLIPRRATPSSASRHRSRLRTISARRRESRLAGWCRMRAVQR